MAAVEKTTELAPAWRPRRLGHANLYVTRLDRSMDFYKDVVGLEEVYRRPSVKAGFLSNGNTHHDIGMVEVTSPLARQDVAGLNHLAFELEHERDLVAGYRRASEGGASFPRTVDHDITRSVYGADPDGNAVEIYADMTRDWRTRRTGTVTKPTGAWTPGTPAPTSARNYHAEPEIRRLEAAVFHPVRITHAVLVVADFAGALGYYRDTVGLTLRAGGVGGPFAALGGTCGGHDLTLFPAAGGRAPGLHHIGFLVVDEDDLAASRDRLGAAGLAAEVEIDHPARRCLHVRDPDGMRIQFYVDRPGAAVTDAAADLALYLA